MTESLALSVVVPAHNGGRHLEECAMSILGQSFSELELLLVDDASADDTRDVILSLAERDSRVRPVLLDTNVGTLGARQAGVAASCGAHVMLVDQDDELAPGALDLVMAHADEADIVHFGVRVVPEGDAASGAAAGMQGFLTPIPRRLNGADIMRVQFAEKDSFDWHVHHKLFSGDLARRAWGMAAHTRLLLSDDIYLCMILDALALTYVGLSDSPWYLYHLGRGETLGSRETLDALRRTSEREFKGWRLMRDFACEHATDIPRDDWDERVADARDRIFENVSNEMIDELPEVELPEAVDLLLGQWPTDAVAGELWRYVRDRAYERYDRHVEPTRGDSLDQVLCLARKADAQVTAGEGSSRYQEMRRVAHIHLRELAERYPEQAEWLTGAPGGREEGTANSDGPIAGLRRLFGRLRR
ncbi:Glycosyl transferase family 2 [Olsenella sp. KH3B4]|uniref:glycosyltransferase family 2 protein n=1 Tax=Olsenella sp. KH3B4 TaxID=1855394 RepID=UPI0008C95FF6|nr:glycosyltransferase family A protein [Olsenella sp. KH3B4]SES61401.1 Glycosyl transferase family 2 [Olsenella sp. KH3B4]